MLNIQHVGGPARIAGWPEVGTVAGLLDALGRWALCPTWAEVHPDSDPEDKHRGPCRERAWCGCVGKYNPETGRTIYRATHPMYPDSPDAVAYAGNFAGYSFGFSLHTDDPELIAQLDAAIAANMLRPDYLDALAADRERATYWQQHSSRTRR